MTVPNLYRQTKVRSPQGELTVAGQAIKDIVPKVTMTGYIPFARRQVSAVRPPSNDKFKLHQLDTIKAPWTSEEGWRRIVADDDGDLDDDDASSVTTESFVLEKEKATLEEPDVLTIYCDLSGIKEDHVVGCGLRGRWALFKPVEGDGEAFWVFKAKDCE